MANKIQVGNRWIGTEYPPFITAEISANHNQSLDRALALVKAAAETGVDAVKLQTSTPETMTLDAEQEYFRVQSENVEWHGKTLYELYKQAYTPWEWHKPIFELCAKLGVLCFSTPFSPAAVAFLETLNAPMYKIASFENVDLGLIRAAAATGKPVVISSGLATLEELQEAVVAARTNGCKDLILLKCTSNYPAKPADIHLRTMSDMRERFECLVGLSDHTLGIGVAVASVAFGATFIEKHFTLSRKDTGLDSAFSLEPSEMKSLVEEVHTAWQALGQVHYGPTEREKSSLAFRRSIFAATDLKAGDILTTDKLAVVRPGNGLKPKYLNDLVGKRAKVYIKRGTAMQWDLIA